MDPFSIAQWVVRALLAIVFVGMGLLHLIPKVTMRLARLVPAAITGSDGRTNQPTTRAVLLVRLAGVMAIFGGVGILFPEWAVRFGAGILLIAFLVAVFPANLTAARIGTDAEGARSLAPAIALSVVLGALVIFAIV